MSPQQTLDSADYIRSSSMPAVSADIVDSLSRGVEQEFIPLVDADSGLDRVKSSDAENGLIKKNPDLGESFAKNDNSNRLSAKDNKVEKEQVAGSETAKQYDSAELYNDEKVQEEAEDDNDNNEEAGDDKMDQADIGDNVIVDTGNIRLDVSMKEQLDEVKDVGESDKDSAASDLIKSHLAANAPELSNNAVNLEEVAKSGSEGKHFEPFSQQPAVDKSYAEQYSGARSDAYVRHSSEVDQLPNPVHIRNDFGHHQANIFGHRGLWHQHNQPADVMFPGGELHPHLDHGAHPSVWKYSSPVEEFHHRWRPKMQEAYRRSWPESMHEQQYRMRNMADNNNFMQHDQKHFVNHQLNVDWSHVNPQDDHYLRRRNDQSFFSGQASDVVNSQWLDEDMFISQHHHGHRYQYQDPGIHQPNIHVDQVYQQHPLGQRRFDNQASETGFADGSVHSNEQTDNSAVGQIPSVDQRPPSAQLTEEDVSVTGQADDPQYYRDADTLPSSLSEQYMDDASLVSSPVLDRSSDHISGV